MSLLLNRSRILRAVEGSLPPAAEERLRAHLRRCTRCRARYDNLSLAAEALALAADRSPAVAATRARARLLAALSASPNGAPASTPTITNTTPAAAAGPSRRVGIVWIPAAVVTAVAILVLLVQSGLPRPTRGGPAVPADQESSEIHWRGTAPGDTHDVPQPKGAGTLLVYAARKESDGRAGRVRLVAELPGSSDAHVSLTEYLAFGVEHLRTSAFVTVVGIEDHEGAPVHFYLPRPSDEPSRADANTGLIVFRPSIDLAVSHHPGRLRVYALFSQAPLEAALVRKAAAHLVRSAAGAPRWMCR